MENSLNHEAIARPTMILHCVRHGESTYNAEGRVQGHLDIGLSALGHAQAEAIAETLAGEPIAVVHASPLKRALETARIIAGALGAELRTDRRLMEINIGIFQGKLRSEIDRLHPHEIARWKSEDPDYAVPGGESRQQLKERGLAAFRSVFETGDTQAVIVSHGRLLVTTIKALLGISPRQPPYSLQNGSISTLSLNDGQVELVALDRTDHLQGVGLSGKGDL